MDEFPKTDSSKIESSFPGRPSRVRSRSFDAKADTKAGETRLKSTIDPAAAALVGSAALTSEVLPEPTKERIVLHIDPKDPDGSADYIVDIAGHNGFVGLTWKKHGEEREVVGIRKVEMPDRERYDLEVRKEGSEMIDRIAVNRLTEYFGRDIRDGVISQPVMLNNQVDIAAGTLKAWDRDPATWQMTLRET